MASRQVGVVLSIPVHVERSHQAAKIDVQKVGDVSKDTATKIQEDHINVNTMHLKLRVGKI